MLTDAIAGLQGTLDTDPSERGTFGQAFFGRMNPREEQDTRTLARATFLLGFIQNSEHRDGFLEPEGGFLPPADFAALARTTQVVQQTIARYISAAEILTSEDPEAEIASKRTIALNEQKNARTVAETPSQEEATRNRWGYGNWGEFGSAVTGGITGALTSAMTGGLVYGGGYALVGLITLAGAVSIFGNYVNHRARLVIVQGAAAGALPVGALQWVVPGAAAAPLALGPAAAPLALGPAAAPAAPILLPAPVLPPAVPVPAAPVPAVPVPAPLPAPAPLPVPVPAPLPVQALAPVLGRQQTFPGGTRRPKIYRKQSKKYKKRFTKKL
jgi:hypothetical protein